MFEKVLDRGKCRLGWHAGEWRYVSATDCRQERDCPRCRTRSEQVVHDWSSWIEADPLACDRVRRCARCADEETTVEHTWDAWSYERDDACDQRSACSRCGAEGSERRVAHDWGAWQESAFYNAHACVCGRCAEMVLAVGEEQDPERAQSFQAAHRALAHIVESTDADMVRARIRAHSDLLLGPLGSRCVAFSVDQLLHDEDSRNTMRLTGELLERCRVEGIDHVLAEPEPEPEPAEEPAESPRVTVTAPELCGRWRSTEILGSGGFTMTTDTHMLLGDDGRFRWATSGGEDEGGAWSANDGQLSLVFDDGAELTRRYVQTGGGMTFPDDGRYRYWERL